MKIVNPGNALPFYLCREHQLCFRPGCREFDWAIPINQTGGFISFQIPLTAATVPLAFSGEIYNADTNTVVGGIPAASLMYSRTFQGSNWITFFPDYSIPGMPCGNYYIKLNSGTGTFYYSEVFRIVDMFNDKRRIFKLSFTSTADESGGILWNGGYEQELWLMGAVLDTPEVNEVVETATDGDGFEVKVFKSVHRREVLRFPFMPDFWQGLFNGMSQLDVSLQDYENQITIKLEDVGFESDDQDYCFARGKLSWQSNFQTFLGCEPDLSFEVLNNVIVG